MITPCEDNSKTAGNQSRYFNDRSSSSSSQRNHDRSLLYSNDMTHDNNAFINNNNSDKEDKKLNRQSLCNSLLTATTISDTLDCTVHNDIALEIMNEERTSISEKRNENFTKKQANDTSSSRYRESRKRPASPSYRSSTSIKRKSHMKSPEQTLSSIKFSSAHSTHHHYNKYSVPSQHYSQPRYHQDHRSSHRTHLQPPRNRPPNQFDSSNTSRRVSGSTSPSSLTRRQQTSSQSKHIRKSSKEKRVTSNAAEFKSIISKKLSKSASSSSSSISSTSSSSRASSKKKRSSKIFDTKITGHEEQEKRSSNKTDSYEQITNTAKTNNFAIAKTSNNTGKANMLDQLHSENEVLSILNGNTKPFILKKDNQLHVKKTNDKLLIAPTSPCSIVQKNEQLSTTSTSVPHMFSLPIETSPPIIKDVEALDVTMLDLVSTLKSLQSNPPATVSEANKLMNKKQSSSNVVNDINSLDKDIYELIQRQLTIHRKHLEHKEREVALKEMELIQREKQFNDRLKQRTTATSPLRNELSSSLIVTENEKVKQISSPSRKAKTTTVTNNTNQLTENIEPKTSKNENIIVSNQDEKNKTKIAETQLSVLEGGKITKTKPTVSNAEEKMDSLQVSFPNETIRLKPTIEKVPAHLRKSRLNDISTASSPQPVRSNIKSRSRATILDATVFASTFPIPDLYSEEDIKLVPQQSPNNENPTLLSVESVTGSRRKVEFIRNKSQEQLQSTPILRTTSNEVSLDDETIAITTTIPVVDLRLTLEKNRKRIQEEQPVPDTPSIVKDETPIDENQVLLTKILSVESKFDQGENMEEVEEELMVTSKKPMKSIDSKDDQRRSKRQSRFSSHYSSTRQQHSKDYVRNVTSEKTKQHYSTNHIPTNTMYSSDHLSVPHANRMHPYELQQYIDMAHSKHHPRPNTDETDADLRARLYHQRQRSNMKGNRRYS